jgi:hypothetical protein
MFPGTWRFYLSDANPPRTLDVVIAVDSSTSRLEANVPWPGLDLQLWGDLNAPDGLFQGRSLQASESDLIPAFEGTFRFLSSATDPDIFGGFMDVRSGPLSVMGLRIS